MKWLIRNLIREDSKPVVSNKNYYSIDNQASTNIALPRGVFSPLLLSGGYTGFWGDLFKGKKRRFHKKLLASIMDTDSEYLSALEQIDFYTATQYICMRYTQGKIFSWSVPGLLLCLSSPVPPDLETKSKALKQTKLSDISNPKKCQISNHTELFPCQKIEGIHYPEYVRHLIAHPDTLLGLLEYQRERKISGCIVITGDDDTHRLSMLDTLLKPLLKPNTDSLTAPLYAKLKASIYILDTLSAYTYTQNDTKKVSRYYSTLFKFEFHKGSIYKCTIKQYFRDFLPHALNLNHQLYILTILDEAISPGGSFYQALLWIGLEQEEISNILKLFKGLSVLDKLDMVDTQCQCNKIIYECECFIPCICSSTYMNTIKLVHENLDLDIQRVYELLGCVKDEKVQSRKSRFWGKVITTFLIMETILKYIENAMHKSLELPVKVGNTYAEPNLYIFNTSKYSDLKDIRSLGQFFTNSAYEFTVKMMNQRFNERNLYTAEGLRGFPSSTCENNAIYEEITRPMGVLDTIQEATLSTHTSGKKMGDDILLRRIAVRNFRYVGTEKAPSERKYLFKVAHTFGEIPYSSQNFMAINKLSVSKQRHKVEEILSISHSPILQSVLNSRNPFRKNPTSTEKFKSELQSIANLLGSKYSTFLCGLSDNEKFKDGLTLFKGPIWHEGVEAAQLYKYGFPIQIPLRVFVKYFHFLIPKSNVLESSIPEGGLLAFHRDQCRKVLSSIFPIDFQLPSALIISSDVWKVGTSKVFLKYHSYDKLKAIATCYQKNCVLRIARRYKIYVDTKREEQSLEGYTTLSKCNSCYCSPRSLKEYNTKSDEKVTGDYTNKSTTLCETEVYSQNCETIIDPIDFLTDDMPKDTLEYITGKTLEKLYPNRQDSYILSSESVPLDENTPNKIVDPINYHIREIRFCFDIEDHMEDGLDIVMWLLGTMFSTVIRI